MDMWSLDHRSILISFASEENRRDHRRFYYDSRWKSKPGIDEAVLKGWNVEGKGNPISLSDRIWRVHHEILKWKRGNGTNSELEIQRLKREYEAAISKVNPDFQFMFKLKRSLSETYRDEELFWKEKSKEQWLKAGDKNTRFFHNSVKIRRLKIGFICCLMIKGERFLLRHQRIMLL
ncbi:hypothetical protein V5N11_022227 [Cardamine amara subsp. amara]|uniref:Uncharacterized protein n=1 Tax=Cardamine amara subsp. amara TaxID=228776 RepID=A0ABD1BVI6_CARAN